MTLALAAPAAGAKSELAREQHGQAVAQAGDRMRHVPLPPQPQRHAAGNLRVRQAP